MHYGCRDKSIPVFTGTHIEICGAVHVTMMDAGNRHFEHEPGPARVGDNQVASSSQHE